ncbi:MAG TPA: transporter [Nakamurella sp.]|nr:transporter [Nakamurella sp.]
MERYWLTLAVLAVCVLAGYGLLVGWRHRAQRQAGLPELPSVPEDFGRELATALTGLYVCTTTAGNWQDRIVARGLGRRANATAELTADGVLIDRIDDDAIFLPAGSLTAVGTAPGIAGKVMGLPNGVLIISWRLGDVELDSGFRADDPALQPAWIDAAAALIGSARGADHSGSDHDDSSPVRPDGVRPDGGAPTSNGAPA